MNRYRGVYRSNYRGNSRGRNLARTFIKQIIACIIIVLIAIVIKKMDIAIVNKTVDTMKAALSKDITSSELVATVKNAAVKIKEVPAYIAESFHAGEEKLAFAPPTDEAAVVSTFGEKSTYFGNEKSGFSRGMTFASDKEMQVHSIGGGTVVDVSTSSLYGKYIKVEHDNGITSIYGGCTNIYVKPLDKVKKGAIIASVEPSDDSKLTFELWVDGTVVNPNEYIKF